jgi:protein-S-isoprenylcysteine O-methyltransferase Ste14
MSTSSGSMVRAHGVTGRVLVLVYGAGVYAFFFATFLYLIGFVGDWIVPKSIDTGDTSGSIAGAVIVDVLPPRMSVGHLLFAVTTTAYILIAIQIEEMTLIQLHGRGYRDYQRRVPMLLPIPGAWRRPVEAS